MADDNIKVDGKIATGKTSVFLAWSGPVSQKMASLLKKQLPLFVRNVTIFMSEDITKGKRWHAEIANALGATKFGILCLTPENLTSDWIHFEAGALSKTIDDRTHVCPLLLDVKMSELKEPLASFNATLFEKEEFKKLVKALAGACGDSLEDGQFDTLMEALWPKIDEAVKNLKNELAEARRKNGKPDDTKPKADPLLEEVVVRVREQGRLLATLTEQNGQGLRNEILRAIEQGRIQQQEMMYLMQQKMDRQRLLKELEEDRLATRDINLTPRMQELATILRRLPPEIAKSPPEVKLEFLIQHGLLSERMLDVFGGHTGAIDAIDFLINTNRHHIVEDNQK